jgi:hypothetical protein
MGKVNRLELWWQLYLYVTSGSGLRKKTSDHFMCIWVYQQYLGKQYTTYGPYSLEVLWLHTNKNANKRHCIYQAIYLSCSIQRQVTRQLRAAGNQRSTQAIRQKFYIYSSLCHYDRLHLHSFCNTIQSELLNDLTVIKTVQNNATNGVPCDTVYGLSYCLSYENSRSIPNRPKFLFILRHINACCGQNAEFECQTWWYRK